MSLAESLTRWPFSADADLIAAVKSEGPSALLRPIKATFSDGTSEIHTVSDVAVMRRVKTVFSLPDISKRGMSVEEVEKFLEES